MPTSRSPDRTRMTRAAPKDGAGSQSDKDDANVASGGLSLEELKEGKEKPLNISQVKDIVNTTVAEAVTLSMGKLQVDMSELLKTAISDAIKGVHKVDDVIADRTQGSSTGTQKRCTRTRGMNTQRRFNYNF